MANGQPGLSPLQQFIGQYMETAQFLEQQRQAAAQEFAQARMQENQELEMFAGMLPSVPEPEQRAALADIFKKRNPQAAITIDALNAAVPVSIRTRLEMAAPTLDVPEFASALRAQLGQELTANEAAQFSQREAEIENQNAQFFAELNQRQNQFSASLGLQERELDLQGQLGFGNLGVAQGRLALEGELGRGNLALGQFEAQNRRDLGMMDANVRGGTFPELMRAEQSRAIAGLQAQLNEALIHPARRQAIQQEIADRQATMRRMDELWKANLANLVGAQAAQELGGMNLAQLFNAAEVAQRQVDEASDTGTREAAIARLNVINTLINQAQSIQPQPLLRPHNPWFLPFGWGNGTRVAPAPGGTP